MTSKKAEYILNEYANCYSQKDLENLTEYLDEIKAEAVKDLLIRLTMHFATYRAEDEIKIKDMFQIIQKFAEETVGDNND